jgi:hypothetical protein
MIKQIQNYPSIIARPYIRASKKDAQWKDNQRYTFESLITVLASYAVSDLLNVYMTLREPVESGEGDISEEDLEIIESLKNIENLKSIGLEQMSLGKWCAVLRETTKVLKDYQDKSFIPELYKNFQPPSNKLWDDINSLVKQRNDDAHGVPISDSELKKVLTSRQEILDRILEQCSFLENYTISIFEKLVLKSNSQQVSGKSFVNDGQESIIVPADLEPPLGEILLVNHNKKFTFIKLRPLIVYAPINGQDSRQLSLYSKQLDKEGNQIHYLGVDGAVDVDVKLFDKKYNQSLGQRWKHIHEIYSEEDVHIPNLNGNINVPSSIEVNEENSLKVVLDNKNSIDVNNVNCLITFPKTFEILLEDDSSFKLKDESSNTYAINLESLDSNIIKNYEIKFSAKEQGSVRISSPFIGFEYFRTEADSSIEKFTSFETRLDGASIQVTDPKSPDKMVPVINVNRQYLASDNMPINNIEIGENFLYELSITNIGIGAARDLSIEVVFPEHLELVEGVDELTINLNPSETRSFRYLASTKVPGQYKIHLRDLSYRDFEGNKYISSFSDDFSIVVKSNIEKQFQFELANAIEDFTIDDFEKQKLDLRKEQLREIYKNNDEIDIEDLFTKALFDAAIKNIRNIVSTVSKKRDFEVTEKIIQETKNQAKLNDDDNPRKALIFSVNEVPFFGVDITNPENIIFHSIDGKMIENIHDFTYKILFGSNAISGYTLPLSMKYEPMLWSDELDVDFFKKWVNLSISLLSKEILPIFEIKTKVEDALNIKLTDRAGSIQKWFGKGSLKKTIDKEVKEGVGLFPDTNSFSVDEIIFRETGIIRIDLINSRGEYFLGVEGLGKDALKDDEWTKNNIVYLSNQSLGQKDSDLTKRWFDDERISWWWIKSNKSTNCTFVKVKNGDIAPFLELIKLHQMAVAKLYLNSEIFNKQSEISLVENSIEQLSHKEFSVRPSSIKGHPGIGHRISLEIYPYQQKLGVATVNECIGFLHKSRSMWKLYVNFYSFNSYSDYESIIKNNFSIYPYGLYGIERANRFFSIKAPDENSKDQLEIFFKLLNKTIEVWSQGAKSIWPSFIIREMIAQFINSGKDENRAERAKFLEEVVTNNLNESSLDKQYKAILRSCEKLYNKNNVLVPIQSKDGVISIDKLYQDSLKELAQAEKGFNGLIEPYSKNDTNKE